MSTIVYIDGFNLYYGAVKGTAHKWLDIEAMCRRLLPHDNISTIPYFTARIATRPDDQQQAVRQQTYLRALATFQSIEIHFGHYVTRPTRMALVSPAATGPRTVEVFKTEEKGSDVNLATYLLIGAAKGRCQTAVVISNDSDLAEPIRLAASEFGVRVGVINPHRRGLRIATADDERVTDVRLDGIRLTHDEDNVLTMIVRSPGGSTEPLTLVFAKRRAPVAQFLRQKYADHDPGAGQGGSFKTKLGRFLPGS